MSEIYCGCDDQDTCSLHEELANLRRQVSIYEKALEKIVNHKLNSVDKIYLLHQVEGYQIVARAALEEGRK
jgi:hypothetical protein